MVIFRYVNVYQRVNHEKSSHGILSIHIHPFRPLNHPFWDMFSKKTNHLLGEFPQSQSIYPMIFLSTSKIPIKYPHMISHFPRDKLIKAISGTDLLEVSTIYFWPMLVRAMLQGIFEPNFYGLKYGT